MATLEETKAKLEQESVILTQRDASAEKLLALAKDIFAKGYGDTELICKVGSIQIGYIELYNAAGATNYAELSDAVKLNLANMEYVIEDGVVAESVTIQASNPATRAGLRDWANTEADYFDLKGESQMTAARQLDALLVATRSIAAATDELDKLEFLMRPAELHSEFLKALMEAKGLKFERTETAH